MRSSKCGVAGRVGWWWRAALAVAAAGWLAGQAHAQAAESPPREYRLANGLRLIVKEDRRAPIVTQMVWYRAGSIDERNGATGVAHVLEHMMFKGTRAVGPGEFSRRVAAMGGHENAMTTRDFTMYYQRVEASRLADVMALEADRMVNLRLTDQAFAPEMRVIKEERRLRIDDSAYATVYEQMLAAVFNSAPYRNPTIGWPSDLETMTRQDALDWYRAWYAPNNATVVVIGDVKAQQVLRQAQRIYGRLKPRDLPRRPAQEESRQLGVKRIGIKASAENPYVVLAYKVPSIRDVGQDVDPFALTALAAVLGGYDNARLPRMLVKGAQPLANDVSASYDGINRGPSLFMMAGVPTQGHDAAGIERALRAQIERIAREGVTEAELGRVKAQLVSAHIYRRDSVFGQGMEIGMAEMAGLSWRDLDRMLEKIRAVTPAQIQRVARTYFDEDNLVVATLLPQPIDPNQPARQATPGLREEGVLH